MCRVGGIEGAIERDVVAHIDDLAANPQPGGLQTSRLDVDALWIHIQDRDLRAVDGERLGVAQANAAGATRDDHAVVLHGEQLVSLHGQIPEYAIPLRLALHCHAD